MPENGQLAVCHCTGKCNEVGGTCSAWPNGYGNFQPLINNNEIKKEDEWTIQKRIATLEQHKNYQIAENKKVSRFLDRLQSQFDEVCKNYDANRVIVHREPFKCPVCEGCGNDKGTRESNPNFEFCMKYASCHACKGKGMVWI